MFRLPGGVPADPRRVAGRRPSASALTAARHRGCAAPAAPRSWSPPRRRGRRRVLEDLAHVPAHRGAQVGAELAEALVALTRPDSIRSSRTAIVSTVFAIEHTSSRTRSTRSIERNSARASNTISAPIADREHQQRGPREHHHRHAHLSRYRPPIDRRTVEPQPGRGPVAAVRICGRPPRLWTAVRTALLPPPYHPCVTVTEPTHRAHAGPTPGADLPSQYVPAQVEGPLYERWVERATSRPAGRRTPSKPPFCIVIPPPNVTGSLHLGHAFEHTLMDALTRRRRMQGYDALWLPGMDHAGIATQNVVERELAKEGLSRHDLGREAFVERVWQWKEESGGRILGQMRRLGDGVDWSRERFTMDEGLSRAVQTDLQAAVRRRPDLPGRADHQLVPAVPDRAVGHRGRALRRRRRAGLDPVRRRATPRSSSRPPGPRRCSATPRSPCTRTTSATGTWSAPRSSCR